VRGFVRDPNLIRLTGIYGRTPLRCKPRHHFWGVFSGMCKLARFDVHNFQKACLTRRR
jgi:hypothetical protein